MWNVIQESTPMLGISTELLQQVPKISKVSSRKPMFLGSGSVPCWFPSYQSGEQEFPDVQVSCFCRFHQPGLDPFALHSSFSASGFQFSSVVSTGCLLLFLPAAG